MPDSALATIYVALAFIAQFAVLGFLPLMLLLGPVAAATPRKGLVFTLAIFMAAATLTILVLDTNIFAQYRYHLSRLTVEIFETSTWVFAGIIFVIILLFQTILAANGLVSAWRPASYGASRNMARDCMLVTGLDSAARASTCGPMRRPMHR